MLANMPLSALAGAKPLKRLAGIPLAEHLAKAGC
jgi:hypothetical protein